MSCVDVGPLPLPTRTCAILGPLSAPSTRKLRGRGRSETHPFQTPLPVPPHFRKTEDMDTQDDLEDTRGRWLACVLGQQLWRRACCPPESGQMDGDAWH